MGATLMNHCGAHEVSLDELATIAAPPATATWFPVPHIDVHRAVDQTLRGAGYEIKKQSFSVAREGHRFFGIMDLSNTILEGVTLAVGIRNSTDKSFPIGMVVGSRVFCCDNLAFHGEIVIAKKHTRFGEDRYREGIAQAISSLGQYQTAQAQWINQLRSWRPSSQEADSLILRSYEEEVIGARLLPEVLHEWRHPSHEEFHDQSAWSLWNAFTTVLGLKEQANPAKAARTTIRLQRLFRPEVIDVPASPTLSA